MFYFTNEKNNPRDHLFNFSWELLRTNLLAVPLEMLIGAPGGGWVQLAMGFVPEICFD